VSPANDKRNENANKERGSGTANNHMEIKWFA